MGVLGTTMQCMFSRFGLSSPQSSNSPGPFIPEEEPGFVLEDNRR